MFETVIIVVVVAGAALYTGVTLFRAIAGRRKSCRCETGCPISDQCNSVETARADRVRSARK